MVTARNSHRKSQALTHPKDSRSLKPSLDDFAKLMVEATEGESAIVISQAQETLESASLTAMHAKTTYDLAKITFKTARKSAKTALTHMKENPEPFVAAAVPVAISVWTIVRRMAKNRQALAAQNSRH